MRSFRSRKGMPVTSTMGIIAGSIIGLLAINIGTGFLVGMVGGNTAVQEDINEVESLVSTAEAKCSAAVDCVEDDETTQTLTLRAAQSIEITGEPPDQKLVVEFPDDRKEWNLEHCSYEVSSEDLSEASAWEFTTSAETGNPPTVSIQSNSGD